MAKKVNLPEDQGFDAAKLYLWVKGLESKVNNLIREVDIIKNDFIKKNNEFKKEMKSVNGDFLEFKHEQEKTLQKMDLIIKELKQTAGIEEVMIIKKYIDLWNPLNFVTQKDLQRVVDERIILVGENKKNKEIKKDNTEKHGPFH